MNPGPRRTSTPSSSGTFLGFDFGRRRIGVAVGQRISGTATALTVLPASEGNPDWDAVAALVREWAPEGIVIGVPRTMSGEDNEITRAARSFGEQLRTRFDVPLHEMDERLSSVQARNVFRESRRAGAARRRDRAMLDAAAARVILEDWLRQEARDS